MLTVGDHSPAFDLQAVVSTDQNVETAGEPAVALAA